MDELLKKIKLNRLPKNEQIFLEFYNNSKKKIIDDCIYYIGSNKNHHIKIEDCDIGLTMIVSYELILLMLDDKSFTSEQQCGLLEYVSSLLYKYTDYKIECYDVDLN